MPAIAAIVALACAAVGWYYLFLSRAAVRLGDIEEQAANRRRMRLRRINGAAMFLLAVGFYAGFVSVDPYHHPAVYALVWIFVMILVLMVAGLAAADIRLTARLRRRKLP